MRSLAKRERRLSVLDLEQLKVRRSALPASDLDELLEFDALIAEVEHLREELGRAKRPIPIELLLAFTRRLVIDGVPSGDALVLCFYAAQADTGASDEEMERLKEAIRKERKTHPQELKGFYPDDDF